ncbi:class I SAM-dependent methyltransferase [Methylosinus sp. H3A]|uniref:class I SAM-dependent methyltransferase n=1 Tax=Methylosinus sp. H3A TaxID=2785786 RepID=UPI0018C30FEA|nr:class I SAM-dependent methyltransferase [Methylosinus sp. H3A]MBG0808563.1 class I SAM-dependent methyltransferase [Methylosinus sp. H3A]
MAREYDDVITEHYNAIADKFGTSPQSTMADDIVRAKETEIIKDFVHAAASYWRAEHIENGGYAERAGGDAGLTVLDVGCGNGFTIKQLASCMPQYSFVGVEMNDRLRDLAIKQNDSADNVNIIPGDIRNIDSIELPECRVDILLCQRVLINIMSDEDAAKALDNIISIVRPGGHLLFIESFLSGLNNLNDARSEFLLAPISPAHHNKYLSDNFFSHPQLTRFCLPHFSLESNALSTHYYVSRVLHAALLQQQGDSNFRRNSHFVQLLSSALPDGVGDYAPLQFRAFTKQK